MRTPAVVVNFKTYEEASGKRGIGLAKLCEAVAEETDSSIIISPTLADLSLIASLVEIPVFSQHVDNLPSGSYTGWFPPEIAKASGATGTLLNHSERRIKTEDIRDLIKKCSSLKLETIVCADDLLMSRKCASLGPDFVAIEPPGLIGGEVSVTTAKPEIVRNAVLEIQKTNPKVKVLCGAGVKDGRDVRKALELGTEGVLLSSGVVKARNPRMVLLDLVSGL